MGYSAERTLGKLLAYGDNVEKALTLFHVSKLHVLRRVFGESYDAKRETKWSLVYQKLVLHGQEIIHANMLA
mgnify:FL=1